MALYLIINFHIARSFHMQLMFVLFHLQPINSQPRLYPSLPGVEGAQGISAGGPKGRLAAPRKRQPSWFRISLDDSKDPLNIIQTFGQARPENLRINISHPKTINILIPICLAIWAPSPASRMADSRRPGKKSLHGFESASITARIS